MVYIAIGVALLLWGALVGRVGRKLGTLLAILPVLVWGGVLAWFTWSGATDRSTGDALPRAVRVSDWSEPHHSTRAFRSCSAGVAINSTALRI